jgi:WD40 repeat protein
VIERSYLCIFLTTCNLLACSVILAMDTARKLSSCIARSTDINGVDNFLQGCSFSPDGLCVLTYSVGDSLLRLYNSPSVGKANDEPTDSNETSTDGAIRDWTTILSANGGDTVRCYTWYPMMNSQDPASCCFLAASRYAERAFTVMY